MAPGEHWKALTAWRAGERTVVFPTGTWWMRVHTMIKERGYPSTPSASA